MTKKKAVQKPPSRKRAPGGGRKPALLEDRHQIRHQPEEWDRWEAYSRKLGYAGPSAWLRDLANRTIATAEAEGPLA